jgi:hypothetical protein
VNAVARGAVAQGCIDVGAYVGHAVSATGGNYNFFRTATIELGHETEATGHGVKRPEVAVIGFKELRSTKGKTRPNWSLRATKSLPFAL